MTSFTEKLALGVQEKGPLCVGLDPHLHLLPLPLREKCIDLGSPTGRTQAAEAVREWSHIALGAIADQVAIVKPQIALYEQLGSAGLAVLEEVVAAAKNAGLLVLMDAKRGDIGSTAEAYAKAILDDNGPLACDAVTLSPYLGRDSMAPFIKRCGEGEKGVFVLLRTSNPGGAEIQKDQAQSAEIVRRWVDAWNTPLVDGHGLGPVGVVVGATLGEELSNWRLALPNAWLLMPGFGAQGASAIDCRAGFRTDGLGALINSSRGVLFAQEHEEDEYAESPGALIARKTETALHALKSAATPH